MKYLIAVAVALATVCLLLLPTPAVAATMQFHSPDLTITLREDSCADKGILAMIEEQYRSLFRSATVVHKGKSLKACWMANRGAQEVIVIDETGDYGPVPMALFKRLTES